MCCDEAWQREAVGASTGSDSPPMSGAAPTASFSAYPALTSSMLARRVHPQLAAHLSTADVGRGAQHQPPSEPAEATVSHFPLDEEQPTHGGDDSWLPSVLPSPPPLPVTLRLCASGIVGNMSAVLSFLHGRSDINQLDLRANGLSDDSLAPLLAAMGGPLSNIRALDLSGVTGFAANRIGQETAATLRALLASSDCQLHTLRLAAMGRTSLSLCLLQHRCLASCASLTALDLGGNQLTTAMVRSLCRQLSSQRCAMRRLSLSRNELTDACCDALAALIRYSTTLSELSLAANQLTGRCMHVLAASLEPDTCSLTSLVLDDNHLLGEQPSEVEGSAEERGLYVGAVGLDRLFRSLSVNSSLQRLSLSCCSIANVDELSSSLAVNSTLTTLVLDRNPLMGSTGCAQLMNSLAHNSTLLSLSLAHNRLDNAIAPHLARLIQANPYLQALSLADNQLTDDFIHAVLPTVYLNSHCAVSRLDLTTNHLQGKHTDRLQSVMQRNARVQRRRLLSHYQHTISRLHALPGQLREAALDIERLQRECEHELSKEASTAQRVQAERAAMEADTITMRAQLDAMREARRQQTARQSAELAELSSRLAAERGEFKSQAASLRQEVVNEKKIQAQLAKQISRASAVWDSLEEIRRSGDIVERSLQQQAAQLHSDARAAGESCSTWATKLQHAATALVNKYWIAFNTYTHSKRFADRNHSAQIAHRANMEQQTHSTPALAYTTATAQQQQLSSVVSTSAPSSVPSLLTPAGLADWSSLQRSGVLSFVPSLPAVGAAFDVDLSDFLSWFFSTSTPSATLALVPAAMAKRMPIIAFAQAKCQTEAGPHTKLFVQPAVLSNQTGANSAVQPSWPSRRSHVSLLGLLRLTVVTHSPLLASMVPSLFSGCTLVAHPADSDSATERPRSADTANARSPSAYTVTEQSDAAAMGTQRGKRPLTPLLRASTIATSSTGTSSISQLAPGFSSSVASATATSSHSSPSSSPVLQLSIDSSSSWPAVLQAVSGLLSLDCSSPASAVRLSCLPGIRLCQPIACYLDLAADTPRLTLEEAMSELGGLNAITAAAAQRKQMLAVDGQSAAGEVSDTALPTLSDDLNQLLADIGADLMLSARSRPQPTQIAAAQHNQSKRLNRKADSRQQSSSATTNGAQAAVAVQGEPRDSLTSEHSNISGDMTGGSSDSYQHPRSSNPSAATAAPRFSVTSGAAAMTATSGTRSQSHSLHRASLLHQRSRAASIAPQNAPAGRASDSEQQRQHTGVAALGTAASTDNVALLHARHSSLHFTSPASVHTRQTSNGSIRTNSRLSHTRPMSSSGRQLSSITAPLAAGAAKSDKEQQRTHNNKLASVRDPGHHEHYHNKQQTQAMQRRQYANRAARRGSRASTLTRNMAVDGGLEDEERSLDDESQLASEGEEGAQHWLGDDEALQVDTDDQMAANERPPLPLSVSVTAVDVSSVVRQPPAPWWSGTRASPAPPSIQPTRAPFRAADFHLGDSDALLPFAPNNHYEQQIQQHHSALFAHLVLNNQHADFAADDTYTHSAAPAVEAQQQQQSDQRGGSVQIEGGILPHSKSANIGMQKLVSHWQLMSQIISPQGESAVVALTLSAACLAAVRPWPALCSETMVH